MHVVDAAGEDVGRVEMVQIGDPESATTAGNEARRGPFDAVAKAIGGEGEPDVPEPLRSRLVRSGYLKVDGPGLLSADRYVQADYVRDVADDRVRLSVRKEELAREH
jgi:hypothetical protein